MPVKGVDNEVVQGILHAIPGEGSVMTKLFRADLCGQRHRLRMCVVELVQHLAHSSPFAPGYLVVVELTARRGKRIQEGRRMLADKSRKHIYQHLLIRSQVGEDVFHRPETARAWSFRIPFWKLCEGL